MEALRADRPGVPLPMSALVYGEDLFVTAEALASGGGVVARRRLVQRFIEAVQEGGLEAADLPVFYEKAEDRGVRLSWRFRAEKR